ncbi:ABC transporter ATP-binding protein [Nocardioides bigeumensis]|uniref:ABC transporter ATP-binding protein n=1 Tax=Nocardioides bigeumensis TaxID=433657 RepID=A0ABP5JG13_9ACTN
MSARTIEPESTSGTRMDTGEDIGALDTIRRGVAISPELRQGLGVTLLLAVVASFGQVIVPIAVQQTLDRGLNGPGGPDVRFVALMGLICAAGIGLTSAASYLMTSRLFTSSERGLATLRTKAFRHVHDLPLLTQNTERRGALVSRVTSDVDQVSQFLVFGGLIFVVSIGQMLVATVIMLVYSWQLCLVVWVSFAPLFLSIRYFQRKLSDAYSLVRRQVGVLLSAISEPVVGAAVVRSYAVEARTQRRIDDAIDEFKAASTRAQTFTVISFSLGGISAGLANAGVIVVGVLLGFTGDMTSGQVLAFAFLVTLFVGPVQMGTQILTDAQNAIASWRRVIGILDTPADLVDPGVDGQVLPRGPIEVRFDDVTFAYPDGPPVLRDVTLSIAPGKKVAIVGETGSGKSTFAKLLTRLMDPSEGAVLLDDIDVRRIAQRSLRRSVVLVPQEGFLFDDTITANVQYGRLGATEAEILASADELGLTDWVTGLPGGLETQVGQRGESLSAGERQLVALLRAHLADPDLLVLDEATSAVDPALEMRIGRALERLMSGRTSVTIAHRLSTAEAADEVVVVDRGRVVQRGPHAELVGDPDGVYAGLHRSWVAQQGAPATGGSVSRPVGR